MTRPSLVPDLAQPCPLNLVGDRNALAYDVHSLGYALMRRKLAAVRGALQDAGLTLPEGPVLLYLLGYRLDIGRFEAIMHA